MMIKPKGKYAVYRAALDTYGARSQTVVAMEEMAELTKELSKNLRGESNIAQIAEGIADVRIMLDQMEMLHSCTWLASCYKSAKINRLVERLKGESNVQKTDV